MLSCIAGIVHTSLFGFNEGKTTDKQHCSSNTGISGMMSNGQHSEVKMVSGGDTVFRSKQSCETHSFVEGIAMQSSVKFNSGLKDEENSVSGGDKVFRSKRSCEIHSFGEGVAMQSSVKFNSGCNKSFAK